MAQQSSCKECGWTCRSCDEEGLLQLHVEVENLKQQLLERENHIRIMEASFLAEADKFPNGEAAALTEELLTWQDKYSRLYESYKRVQKVNQSLEDKLLRIVDKCETEKNDLLKEVSSLTQRLIDARSKVNRLQSENERYRNDVNVAIHLLQCKPTNFVPQKYDSLPTDLQQKVLAYVCGRRRPSDSVVPVRLEMRTIKVPVSTSPPSSMLYSVNKSSLHKGSSGEEDIAEELMPCEDALVMEGRPPLDNVSAAIMAKVLEERERERQQTRHCDSCTCFTNVDAVTVDIATQTHGFDFEASGSACLNGYTATTRGSQGLVRFVDSLSRNSSSNSTQISCPPSSSSLLPSKLGVRIGDSKSIKCDFPTVAHSDNVDKKNIGNLFEKGRECSDLLLSDNLCMNREDISQNEKSVVNDKYDCLLCDNQLKIEVSSNSSIHNSKLVDSLFKKESSQEEKTIDGCSKSHSVQLPENDNSANCDKENCIIDLEVSSDGRSDIPSANRGKELLLARNNGDIPMKGGNVGHNAQTNSHAFSMKIHSKEAKSAQTNDPNISVKSPSSWVRYPSDANKKSTLVVANDKISVPMVRSAETVNSRVTFPTSSVRSNGATSSSGPRLCSMRLQAGTSNILLDNATSYEPVLYTSRHTQDGVEAWGVGASRSGAAVLVHAPRSRAPSLDEAGQQSKVALWVHANPGQTGT